MSRAGVISSSSSLRVTDIAVNLADCVFRGFDWKNKKIHADDFTSMMARADAAGVHRSIISGTSLEQCIRALYLCRQFPGKLYCTIGVHPANSTEFLAPVDPKLAKFIQDGGCGGDAMGRVHSGGNPVEPFSSPYPLITVDPAASAHTFGSPMTFESLSDEVKEAWKSRENTATTTSKRSSMMESGEQRLELLRELIIQNRDVVVAVGECGLDGTETAYCPLHVQEYYFRRQIQLAQQVSLPLFLHSRECEMQFADVICGGSSIENPAIRDVDGLHKIVNKVGGVVHSFCGSVDELQRILTKTPLYLGLNGTAFRSEETAMMCCNNIPLERLMLETDSPWCDIRKDNFGFKFIKSTFPTKKKDKFAEGCCVERRNEPCYMKQVLEVYEGCLRVAKPDVEVSIVDIGNVAEANVNKLFFPRRDTPSS